MLRILVTLILLLPVADTWAETISFPGDSIPQFYRIESAGIFLGSDSLYLGEQLLISGEDYTFNNEQGWFDLTSLEADSADTLVITYHPWPRWLNARYGRDLPEIVPSEEPTTAPRPLPRPGSRPAGAGTNLQLSGAKTFRFSARSAGGSEFGQSLDLTLSGELSPGLTIRGAVSDRGFDPAYGTANSRLNELNKINLELESKRFQARIGDISLTDRQPILQSRSKRLEGAWLNLRDPSYYAEAAVARPKGQYTSARFYGAVGVQGPYRIGGRAQPIVPGSEEVWLDGERLERGAGKDYVMDYPAGTITFNVSRPIDSRSRIEIDYEPQATDYRGELFTGGGGVAVRDSMLTIEVGWLREGDDKDQPLFGELSDSERDLLASLGDSVTEAFRSGVQADTSGNYVLLADSLPDTVYQYVGADTGDFSVTFSFVGTGQGAYRNLGSNRFEYAGPGNGDYLPVVTLSVPQRIDQYATSMALYSDLVGTVSAQFRRSDYDRNLFSSEDDADNGGSYYRLGLDRSWSEGSRQDSLGWQSRFVESTFRTRERLNQPEFYRAHHLPVDYVPSTDEWLHEGAMRFAPARWISIRPELSLLRYDRGTQATAGGATVEIEPHSKVALSTRWRGVSSDLRTDTVLSTGDAETIGGSAEYRPGGLWVLSGEVEHDERTNNFNGPETGTRYQRYRMAARQSRESVRLEHYVEDTALTDWAEVLTRTRLELRSRRSLREIDYDGSLTYQWLDDLGNKEESFLGRLNLDYTNPENRLTISAGYILSEETRSVRGITFLEVEPGEGDFVFEDGRYVPDPDGDYIRIEEILSDQSRVSRGEKSFYLSKMWSQATVRFTSRIEEELREGQGRSGLWALPFYSDPDLDYQFYTARYSGDVRLIKIRNAHAINITASLNREIRAIGSDSPERLDRRGTLTLKQSVRNTFFEESIEIFDSERDSYFTGAGVIDGYRIEAGVRQVIAQHEVSGGAAYRDAEAVSGERSQQYILEGGVRLAVISRGELRTDLEVYRQQLENVLGVPTYTLTDNRSGERGGRWSVELRYGLSETFRLNFSVSGRHSDDRTARVTARGQMVAGF